MKRKLLLRGAIALIVISTLMTTYLRLQKKNAEHSADSQRNISAESDDVIQDAIAAGRRRTPKDLSVVQIQELARTPSVRLNLCGIIGESALVGLSDNSYQQVLVALSDVESLEDTCLREIMLRLGNEVNEPAPHLGTVHIIHLQNRFKSSTHLIALWKSRF